MYLWRRASGLRRGFTNHCENADSIDDIVGGGGGVDGRSRSSSSLCLLIRVCVREEEGAEVVVSVLGRRWRGALQK